MTELQDRLEHLVNYSSQLIFVSGDTIAQQQRSLEDFLSVQKENTEISYIKAETTFEPTDYRRLICRQLIGQTVGSYVRPLKELLKELLEQPGPFLVCIKQAELMPNEFLQELWDWVIYSRKHTSKQHLNIILFAETKWAEQAKQWLPNKNSDKPVLLSSQSVEPSGFDSQALASLMSQPKSLFPTDLFSRDSGTNLLTKKWFISAVMLTFFVVFITMMSWQYPTYVESLLTTGKLPAEVPHTKQVSTTESSEAKQTDSTSANDTVPTQLELVPEDPFIANDILVSDWQTQENKVSNDADDAIIISSDSTQIAPPQQSEGLDFAVPDILNIEQLDAVLEGQLAQPDDLGLGEINDQNVVQNPAQNQQFQFDERIILGLPDDSVLLQLSGIQNPSVLATYIQSNDLEASTWTYQTVRYGGPWYVVVFNQAFSDLDAAQNAASQLPQSVRASAPFAKATRQIKQEIQTP